MTSIAGMFAFSPTMHLEGTWPSLGLSERLLALLPWGEEEVGRRQWTVKMSLSSSLCHTNRGQATNGFFFQSFLADLSFFVCALSSIHLFMSSLSSPFFSSSSSSVSYPLPFFLFLPPLLPNTPSDLTLVLSLFT